MSTHPARSHGARPAVCSYCDQPAVLTTSEGWVRRGERRTRVPKEHWACPGDCLDENGERNHWFTLDQMYEMERVAGQIWQEQFGEPMPASGRPGRKTRSRRDQRVTILLTDSELERLDELRGGMTRSEFLRRSLRQTG